MINVEFLIVGNGLAGTLLAFEMFDRGLDFKILVSKEKSRASLVAAGMVNPLVFKRMTKSWMVDELLPVMKNRYVELELRLNKRFFFEKEILKPLSEQEMVVWKQRIQDVGFSKYIRSVDRERKINSIKQAAGYGIVSQAGYLDLPVFLNAAETFFRNKNLVIDGRFPFEKYDAKSNFIQLGPYDFNKIIFCEGFHVTRNYFFNFLPLKPVKGEVLEIYAPELPEDYILNKKVFVLPIGNKRFKVGSTYDWENLDEEPTKGGEKSILMRFDELVSVDYEIVSHVAGIRPTVSDRRPIIGKHPDWDHLCVFNGLGTKGVMLGPYFAKEVVAMLTIENYSLSNEVQIERFVV